MREKKREQDREKRKIDLGFQMDLKKKREMTLDF